MHTSWWPSRFVTFFWSSCFTIILSKFLKYTFLIAQLHHHKCLHHDDLMVTIEIYISILVIGLICRRLYVLTAGDWWRWGCLRWLIWCAGHTMPYILVAGSIWWHYVFNLCLDCWWLIKVGDGDACADAAVLTLQTSLLLMSSIKVNHHSLHEGDKDEDNHHFFHEMLKWFDYE